MTNLLIFTAGAMLGGCAGMFTMALLVAAARTRRE